MKRYKKDFDFKSYFNAWFIILKLFVEYESVSPSDLFKKTNMVYSHILNVTHDLARAGIIEKTKGVNNRKSAYKLSENFEILKTQPTQNIFFLLIEIAYKIDETKKNHKK